MWYEVTKALFALKLSLRMMLIHFARLVIDFRSYFVSQ
jgi:hypothetical protein